MSVESDVRKILKDNRLTDDKVRALVAYIEGFESVYEAHPCNTHAAIETVEVYGLVIGVDANGYASEVHFPYGAQV